MNRGELEAAAKRMISRPNLAAVDMALAIQLAEDRLAPLLKSQWNQASVDMVVDTSADPIALPLDYAMIDVILDNDRRPVDGAYYDVVLSSDLPAVQWVMCPDRGTDVTVWYFARLALGTDTEATNAALTNSPQIYLYSVLGELAVITRQFTLAERYFQLMTDHVRGLKRWRQVNASAWDHANTRR